MSTTKKYLLIAIVLLLFSSCGNTQQQRKQKAAEYGYMAYTEGQKGNYQQAIDYNNKAIQLDDKNPVWYLCRGCYKYIISDTLGAISDYQQAFVLDSTWEDPLCNLGALYREQQKIAEAKNLYLKAIHVNPNGLSGYAGLGFLFYTIQNYDSAIQYFKQVIEKYPIAIKEKLKEGTDGYTLGNAEIRISSYFFLGLCYQHTGNIEKAKYYLSLAAQNNVMGAEDSLQKIISH